MNILLKIPLKIIVMTGFFWFYLKELIRANLKLTYDILTPTHYMRPGIVEFPLSVKSDQEIITLVNLITMTPGSLSLDISDDKTKLYIHVLYLDDADKFREEIKNGLEKRVAELWK